MAINDDVDKFKKSLPSKGFTNVKNILEDCDRPACDDTMSALSAALKQHAANKASSSSIAQTTASIQQQQNLGCPPTKGALGRSSWDLLHSMAAWYPDNPTPVDETMMQQFFASFARFYPCTWCADDFQKNIQEKPVQTKSRESLCLWLCDQHNIVNEKLGKSVFRCEMKTLDERWRKSSDPNCQQP